ncbi:uncharacterized protein LOC128955894 [Oppia nitens]|uniref:uncharacterized protein LOC128955894 n=1 Tax=Oppia nitens TaxID=1686743 RepID=UPI0023D9B81D|nr:uncharacterized protein LOC128955894 [Oppia nitens]
MVISVTIIVLLMIGFTITLDPLVDPEEQLCIDLAIDAAIYADDGISYILKGDSFWQMDSQTGLLPEAGNLISDRWPGLPTPVNAAFTIGEAKYGLSTVFIVHDKWFLYNNKIQRFNGTTDDWNYFPIGDKVLAASDHYRSNKDRNKAPVYIIYESQTYSKYMFTNIFSPDRISGPNQLVRSGKLMLFISDSKQPTGSTFDNYIDIKAMLTNDRHLIIFGNKNYCIGPNARDMIECELKTSDEMRQYFKCPRKPRPASTTTIETISTIDTNDTTNITTNTKTVVNVSSILPTIESLGADVSNVSINDNIAPNSTTGALTDKPYKKGFPYTMIIIIAVIVLVCVVIVIVVILYVIKHKKSHTKSDRKEVVVISSKNTKQLPKTEELSSKKTNTKTSGQQPMEADQLIKQMRTTKDDNDLEL